MHYSTDHLKIKLVHAELLVASLLVNRDAASITANFLERVRALRRLKIPAFFIKKCQKLLNLSTRTQGELRDESLEKTSKGR